MAEESFLLVSLKDDKAKRLAQTISNETARTILGCLAKKEATESELSKSLGLPLSTVHYNLQHLVESKLVVVDEFHYSDKGKEVNHYKIANKIIIIAPQNAEEGFLKRLKRILPVSLGVVVVGAVIQLFSSGFGMSKGVFSTENALLAAPQAADTMAEGARMVASGLEMKAGPAVAVTSTPVPQIVAEKAPLLQPVVVWFLIGALCTILIFMIVEWMLSRKNRG